MEGIEVFEKIDWKIHHSKGQTYITPKEYNKQSEILSDFRRRQIILPYERSVINVILKSGLRHYYELREYLNSEPRREAQRFIGKKEVREFIFNRDGFMCLCCGSTKSLSIDHVVPVNKNGENEIDNLQTLCTPCNSRKSDNIIDYR
jgi:hypothetical protein